MLRCRGGGDRLLSGEQVFRGDAQRRGDFMGIYDNGVYRDATSEERIAALAEELKATKILLGLEN